MKEDNRKDNRGSVIRRSHSTKEKALFIEVVEELIDSGKGRNVREALRGLKMGEKEVEYNAANYNKRLKAGVMEICLKEEGKKKRQHPIRQSPFHQMESQLYTKIVQMRKESRKVSSTWIRINGRKLFNKIKEEHPNKWEGVDFHGSRGWADRFMRRKRIKYRKKKSGKEVTVLQCVPAFEKFPALVRFKILPPLTDLQEVDSLYGRFPPHLRFNMDQCPLPFVVSQDTTFTVASDNDVHIKCPGEALRKRQFTMHVVYNAGNGARRAGWVDLVCKGTGKRIRQTEKELLMPALSLIDG